MALSYAIVSVKYVSHREGDNPKAERYCLATYRCADGAD